MTPYRLGAGSEVAPDIKILNSSIEEQVMQNLIILSPEELINTKQSERNQGYDEAIIHVRKVIRGDIEFLDQFSDAIWLRHADLFKTLYEMAVKTNPSLHPQKVSSISNKQA